MSRCWGGKLSRHRGRGLIKGWGRGEGAGSWGRGRFLGQGAEDVLKQGLGRG